MHQKAPRPIPWRHHRVVQPPVKPPILLGSDPAASQQADDSDRMSNSVRPPDLTDDADCPMAYLPPKLDREEFVRMLQERSEAVIVRWAAESGCPIDAAFIRRCRRDIHQRLHDAMEAAVLSTVIAKVCAPDPMTDIGACSILLEQKLTPWIFAQLQTETQAMTIERWLQLFKTLTVVIENRSALERLGKMISAGFGQSPNNLIQRAKAISGRLIADKVRTALCGPENDPRLRHVLPQG